MRHFKSKNLKESTVRTFKSKYRIQVKTDLKHKCSPKKTLPVKQRGRPTLLGDPDAKVQKFLKLSRNRGAVINSNIAIATATGFLKTSIDESINHLTLTRPWAQSLFRRMGFVRRFATTGKVEITEGVKREAELLFIHEIVHQVEDNDIPHSMILNLDQTPLKYVPCGKTTLAKKSSKTVPIDGVSDKRMITATFTVTLDGQFLPMQLIYSGKATRSIPKVEFPKGFSLSANPKHFSNEEESLKLMEEIIIPYYRNERRRLGLETEHPGLLIMDVFKGQTTSAVRDLLKENNIFFTKVPANMTNLYQPLDLTVNGFAKSYMKKLFTEWYAKQISEALESGKDAESIEVPLQLSKLKPLHAKWKLKLFNEMTSESGKEVILKGWLKAGIKDGIEMGKSKPTPLDPFHQIDPLVIEEQDYDLAQALTTSECPLYEGVTGRTLVMRIANGKIQMNAVKSGVRVKKVIQVIMKTIKIQMVTDMMEVHLLYFKGV